MTLTGQPSAWDDDARAPIDAILSRYYGGPRRHDLVSVRELLRAFRPARPAHHVAVVGTNGKTSTATFLARLLARGGTRVGLYTSPHIARWSERVAIGGAPVAEEELISTLARVEQVAESIAGPERGELRFFDLLTLAAEDIFGRAGVEVAIFEAGIGGRLDATRVLEPELVVLTSIGLDHRHLLGSTEAEILAAKLAIAPRGSTLVTGLLTPDLLAQAAGWAGAEGVELVADGEPDMGGAELPRFQRRNLALARRAAQTAEAVFGLHAAFELAELGVWGRFERGSVGGVAYLADVAHNLTAWHELLADLPSPGRRWVAVVALTAGRSPAELAGAIADAPEVVQVVATVTPVLTPRDPAEVVAALGDAGGPGAELRSSPAAAFELAAAIAADRDLDLLVTGSNYLVSEFLAWVAN